MRRILFMMGCLALAWGSAVVFAATQNAANQRYTNNADGFILGGGTTVRLLTLTGGDVTLTGDANNNTYNFPTPLAGAGGSVTLVGVDEVQTLTNKTWNGNTISVAYGGTGATTLTGVLKGNAAAAISAMTGTSNYVTRWSDASTLATGVLYDNAVNVGIGTVSPLAKLDLVGAGTTSATSVLIIRDSAKVPKITVLDNGNVGIGTANPLAPLEVKGNIVLPNNTPLQARNAANNTSLSLLQAGADNTTLIWAGQGAGFYNGGYKLFVDSAGNVGIGTSSPSGTLHLKGAAAKLYIEDTSTTGSGIYFNANGGTSWVAGFASYRLINGFEFYAGNISTPKMVLVDTGNVGIGTSVPGSRLHIGDAGSVPNAMSITGSDLYVKGNIEFDGKIYGDGSQLTNLTSSQWTTAGSDIYYNTGNVGIGTTSPKYELDVRGDGLFSILAGSGKTFGVTFNGGTNKQLNVGQATTTWDYYSVSTGTYQLLSGSYTSQFDIWATRSAAPLTLGTNNTERVRIDGTGNVGIGTTAPNSKFNVVDGTNAEFRFNSGNSAQTPTIAVNNPSGKFAALLAGTSGSSFYFDDSGTFGVTSDTRANFNSNNLGNGTRRLTVLGSTGNMGIGTTTPVAKLHIGDAGAVPNAMPITGSDLYVKGNIELDGKIYGDGSQLTNLPSGSSQWTTNGSNIYYNTGYVGIGTSAPGASLHVNGNGILSGTDGLFLSIRGTGEGSGLKMSSESGYKSIQSYESEPLILNPLGNNVGVGTTSPSARFHVVGSSSSLNFKVSSDVGQIQFFNWYDNINYIESTNGNGSASQLLYFTGNSAGAGTFAFNGNVGIGTTVPQNTLDVNGIAGFGSYTIMRGTSYSQILLNHGAGGWGFIGNNSPGVWSLGYTNTSSTAMDNSVLSWTSTGNVGVGTTATTARLNVKGNAVIGAGSSSTRSAQGLTVMTSLDNSAGSLDDSTRTLQIENGSSVTNAFASLSMRVDATGNGTWYDIVYKKTGASAGTAIHRIQSQDIMSLVNTGNVGIGTTAPVFKTDVRGNIAANGGALYVRSSPTISWDFMKLSSSTEDSGINVKQTNFYIGMNNATDALENFTTVFSITQPNGNVGIGTTSPVSRLDVAGDFGSPVVVKGNSTGAVTIDWSAGGIQHVTLTGNVTLTFSNGVSGHKYTLVVKQDATGGRTIAWPASVRWPGGTAPTLTTAASKTDYIGFVYNPVDSTYDGVASTFNF